MTTIFILTSCCLTNKVRQISSTNLISVDSAFKKVYYATQVAINESNSTLNLKTIDLAFTTTQTNEANIGVKLWVVSGTYSSGKSFSKKTVYKFGIPENKAFVSLRDNSNTNFIEYLKSVIKSAENINPIEGFGLNELEVEVEFTISKSIEAGVDFDLSPINPTLNGKKGKEITHTITLTFNRK